MVAVLEIVLACLCSSAYREPSFGHGIVNFINGTHAQWFWNRNQVGALPLHMLFRLPFPP